MKRQNEHWPELPLEQWQETYETLHLWSQIVGKVRLSQMPWNAKLIRMGIAPDYSDNPNSFRC